MATLVLTAVGSVFGPIGGAIGALLGQSIDGKILGPKGREGPRLQDLRIQTSSYGAAIPKLFGTMRVAGTVIWATDLVEHRSRQGGGKGRPSTTTYSYSASFAVLLSARPIRSVRRIWADGNLLRGAAGDWKGETGFRLHLGNEDQAEDPFIASAEGNAGTPAYRGCAYAVFENMALGPFGNRIPSLTFEVEADAMPVPVGTMLTELSGGAIAPGGGVALGGFAAAEGSVRDLVDGLAGALPIMFRDDGERLRLIDPDGTPVQLEAEEIGEEYSEGLGAAANLPGSLLLSYYDPARDYQAGVQQARRLAGIRTDRIDLPAALRADEARLLAEKALAKIVREQSRRTIRCGWTYLALRPGDLLRLPEASGRWRVEERAVDREGVRLDLRRIRNGSAAEPEAESGRSIRAPDLIHGPTVIHLLDLPNLRDAVEDAPRLYVAAAGPLVGWRRASLLVSLDDGGTWASIGRTAAPAIMGVASSVLEAAGEALIDDAHVVDVRLLNSEMLLADADQTQLLAGANLALVGAELIQFGRAEPLGEDLWRLSHLLRGRRGTSWAAASHESGDRFVLLEAETLLPFDPPMAATGGAVRLMASGIGDVSPSEASALSVGKALRVPAPVHLRAMRRDDGGFDLDWIRSSRAGWAWIDGTDAPLAEDRELYRLSIRPAGAEERVYQITSSSFDYTAAAVSADLAIASTVTLSVVQVGTRAVSRKAMLTLSL